MVKIKGEAFEVLCARIRFLDTEGRREAYRNGRFPRADRVRNLEVRYRWDLFYAASGWDVIPEDSTMDRIETALRRIVPPLGGAE